jgi:hypothetical protein
MQDIIPAIDPALLMNFQRISSNESEGRDSEGGVIVGRGVAP